MKNIKFGMVTAAVLGICQMATADALLIDAYGGSNPTTYQDWVDAGVTEDISDGAGATVVHSGSTVYNISGGIASSVTGAANRYGTTQFGNVMLDNYIYGASVDVSFSGLDNTLTSSLGDMDGNTFTLQANQDYKLYLFGVGADGLENAEFTFGGVAKSTSSLGSGIGEDSRFVTYEFTTGSDISGFTLDFSYTVDQAATNGAWNGAALVAVPEPATLGLITAFGGGLLLIRRGFMI